MERAINALLTKQDRVSRTIQPLRMRRSNFGSTATNSLHFTTRLLILLLSGSLTLKLTKQQDFQVAVLLVSLLHALSYSSLLWVCSSELRDLAGLLRSGSQLDAARTRLKIWMIHRDSRMISIEEKLDLLAVMLMDRLTTPFLSNLMRMERDLMALLLTQI